MGKRQTTTNGFSPLYLLISNYVPDTVLGALHLLLTHLISITDFQGRYFYYLYS